MNNEYVAVYSRVCPMCKTISELPLTRKEASAMSLYDAGVGLIQDLLPSCDKFEREFIKTGYCLECQQLLFGNKAPKTCRVRKLV